MRWATTEKTGRFRRFVGSFVWFWGSESSRISQSLRDTRYFCVMYFEERVKWAISSYLEAMKKSSSCLTKCLNISWQGFAHRFSGAKSRSNSVLGKMVLMLDLCQWILLKVTFMWWKARSMLSLRISFTAPADWHGKFVKVIICVKKVFIV